MSSSSSDSEMSFDSGNSEIYYRRSRNQREWRGTLTNIANSKRLRPSWFICWRPSGQRRIGSQIAEGGGCRQRTQTNSEWQTRRQCRNQQMVRLARGACLLFWRLLRSRVKIYFCYNTQVRSLSRFILPSWANLYLNDDLLTQSLCSSGASVEIFAASLPFKTSANVIFVVSS